ncbi:MAG: thymidine kinase [Armatimonadetes bacterium]|nr:thymidine kinase [Anaerolineae bacterium]
MIHYTGRIELICGSMFCGKTEELIRRVRRATIARQTVQVFKPEVDARYSLDHITSHAGAQFEAQPVRLATDILALLSSDTTVVAIDEAQFLDPSIVHVAEQLANQGKRVIMAGLDLDFRGEPFGAMPQLICLAEEVLKLHAICLVCGESATRSQRLVNSKPAHYADPVIVVGAHEAYEARCRQHHSVPGSPYAQPYIEAAVSVVIG